MKSFLARILPTHWCLLILAGVYLLTRNPYASFGDSIGMLYHASLGFDWATNATSHFLYVNLCAFSLKLFPFLDQVLVLSLISWLFAWLSLHRFGQLLKLAGSSEAMAAILMLITGLGFTWWRQAVMIEVYTLSCWVGLGVVFALIKDEGSEKKSSLGALSIGCWWGLALLTHIQFLLLAPLIGWHFWRRRKAGFQAGIGALGLTILVSSPLWILPLVLDTHTLKAVLFDQGYQDQVLHTDLSALAKGVCAAWAICCTTFIYGSCHWVGDFGKVGKEIAIGPGSRCWGAVRSGSLPCAMMSLITMFSFSSLTFCFGWRRGRGSSFKVQGAGNKEQGSGYREHSHRLSPFGGGVGGGIKVQGTSFRVQGAGNKEQGSGYREHSHRLSPFGGGVGGGIKVQGTRFRVQGSRNRKQGSRFRFQ